MSKKETYSEPLLVKHEALLDVTGQKYKELKELKEKDIKEDKEIIKDKLEDDLPKLLQ